jgi:hypothetical protein
MPFSQRVLRRLPKEGVEKALQSYLIDHAMVDGDAVIRAFQYSAMLQMHHHTGDHPPEVIIKGFAPATQPSQHGS